MKKILVIGDSHARDYFSSTDINGKLKSKDQDMNFVQSDFHFDVYYVSGATAQGAVNPKSKTKALSIFKKRLNKINPNDYDYIAIMLGEVDCGFVIWYRSEKYSISVEEQLNLSVNNMFEFIQNEVLLKFKPKQVIVMGSVLPTIRDGQNYGKIAHLRSSVKATQLERTNLTLKYNEMLKKRSDNNNYTYIDITRETLNENTELIDDYYLNEDKNNHHLSFKKIWKFWINNLKEVLR